MAYWGEVEIVPNYNNVNIAENYTPVTANFYAVSDVGSAWSNYTTYANCTLDGTPEDKTISSFNFGNNKRLLLGSITKNVYHNPDGTKTVSASFTWKSNHSMIGTITGSATLELNRIPRTSSISCNSFNIGDATTITISRASSDFKHSLSWTFGDKTGWIATKTSQVSIGITIPASELYSQIPSARSGTGTIWCDTYYGDTYIGTSSFPFTAYAKEVDCIPDVSASITDTNDTTFALTGSRTKFIKGFSNAKVTISASPKNSASIKSYWINMGDGRTSDKATTLFNNIGDKYLSVSVTDSREYAKGVPYVLDWIEYVMLAFTNIEIKRPESTADEATMTIQGNYWNGNFGNKKNSLTLQYRYKEDGGDYSEWTSLTPTISGNTFSYTQLIQNLDHNTEYIFQLMIDDELMTVYSKEQDGILTKGISVLRVGKDYVKVNGDKVVGQNVMTIRAPRHTMTFLKEWVNEKISNMTLFNKTGNKLSLEGNSIKIGKGVSKVAVSGEMAWSCNSQTDRVLTICKNDAEQVNYYNSMETGNYQGMSIPYFILEVTEGDLISLCAIVGASGCSSEILNALLTVQVVEKGE